jgi:hypothetical protein
MQVKWLLIGVDVITCASVNGQGAGTANGMMMGCYFVWRI